MEPWAGGDEGAPAATGADVDTGVPTRTDAGARSGDLEADRPVPITHEATASKVTTTIAPLRLPEPAIARRIARSCSGHQMLLSRCGPLIGQADREAASLPRGPGARAFRICLCRRCEAP